MTIDAAYRALDVFETPQNGQAARVRGAPEHNKIKFVESHAYIVLTDPPIPANNPF
jgi:hypothetical protein